MIFLLYMILVSQAYEPLAGSKMSYCDSHYFLSGKEDVYYSFCSEYPVRESYSVSQRFSEVSTALFNYASKNNFPTKTCAPRGALEIYHVNIDDRFSKILDNPGDYYGLYDPLIDDDSRVVIIFEKLESELERKVFAHEVSHYWYDRFCWGVIEPDPEKFSYAFQAHYMERVNVRGY